MSRSELKNYKTWFLESIPGRVEELRSEVVRTAEFKSWLADCSVESLELLGEWFADQVEMRDTTAEEDQQIEQQLVFTIKLPDKELTNRSFSLAMDIGIYLAEVVRNNVAGAKWTQAAGNKKFADYGQMVIDGLAGPTPLNPVRIVVNLAYGIGRGHQDGARLFGLYKYWAKAR